MIMIIISPKKSYSFHTSDYWVEFSLAGKLNLGHPALYNCIYILYLKTVISGACTLTLPFSYQRRTQVLTCTKAHCSCAILSTLLADLIYSMIEVFAMHVIHHSHALHEQYQAHHKERCSLFQTMHKHLKDTKVARKQKRNRFREAILQPSAGSRQHISLHR